MNKKIKLFFYQQIVLILTILCCGILPASAQQMPHTSYSLQKAEFAIDRKNTPFFPIPGTTQMYTAFTVNKPETNTIIFRDNGDYVFHGHEVAQWKKSKQGKDTFISFKGQSIWEQVSYYQYTCCAKPYYKGDTMILSYNRSLFYYIPYTKAITLAQHDDRNIFNTSVQQGIELEIKYSGGLTAEFGYSYSKEDGYDSGQFLLNITGSYNPSQKIYGAHLKTGASLFKHSASSPFFMDFDLNALFKNNTFDMGFMPEVGLNLDFIAYPLRNVTLTYGYDFFFVNHHIPGVDHAVFGTRLNLPLHKNKMREFKLKDRFYDDKY